MKTYLDALVAAKRIIMASAVTALLLTAGCGGGDEPSDNSTPVIPTDDAASDEPQTTDASTDQVHADGMLEAQPDTSQDHAQQDVTSQAAWNADPAPGTGPAVYLGAADIQNNKLKIPIRGKGIAKLYGLALRLQFDPAVLKFDSMSRGDAWTGTNLLDLAKEARPGLLVGAVTYKGAAAGISVTDGTLGWVEFTLLAQSAAQVQFAVPRSAIVQADGTELGGVSWTGGAVVVQ